MAHSFAVDQWWTPVNLDFTCRNWTGATTVRMSNRAAALHAVQRAINHVLIQCPRFVFGKNHPFAERPSGLGADQTDIYRWLVDDVVDNEYSRAIRIYHQMREADPDAPGGTSEAYAQPLDSTLALESNARGSGYTGADSGLTTLRVSGPDELRRYRGGVPDAERDEGLAVFDNYCPLDVVVQGEPRFSCDADMTYASACASGGSDVLSVDLEKLRARFHELRSTVLPTVLCFASYKDGANYATDQGNDRGAATGVHIHSNTYLNILDLTSTARDANTPGFSSHVQYCGRGDEANITASKQLKVMCRVLGNATVADGTVKFVGPETFANNYTEVTLTAGGGVDWYGTSSNYIYLDTSVANDVTTVNRAKIDVLGKAGTGGELYVYGGVGWGKYT